MTPTDEARLFYADVERSFLGLKELGQSVEEIRSHGRSPLSSAHPRRSRWSSSLA